MFCICLESTHYKTSVCHHRATVIHLILTESLLFLTRMKFTTMIVFCLVVLGAAFGTAAPGSLVLSFSLECIGCLDVMISGSEMDMSDISERAGNGLVGDIGVGRAARYGWWSWPSSWLWGGYGGYRRGGVESNSNQLAGSSRGYGRR